MDNKFITKDNFKDLYRDLYKEYNKTNIRDINELEDKIKKIYSNKKKKIEQINYTKMY